jgi:hypothetical protein
MEGILQQHLSSIEGQKDESISTQGNQNGMREVLVADGQTREQEQHCHISTVGSCSISCSMDRG